MNRNIRFLLAAVLALAFLGYRYLEGRKDHDTAPTPASKAESQPTANPAIGAAGNAPAAITRRLGRLAFTPCTLAPEFGTQSLEAQCTTLKVPENRAAPRGRQIELAIAWVPANAEGAPDPVFFIAGGPGQSALESFPGIAPAFAELRKKRDVILVDQRGTGDSNKLICKDSEGKSAVVENDDFQLSAAKDFAAR